MAISLLSREPPYWARWDGFDGCYESRHRKGQVSRRDMNVICADDHQALHRASDLLAHHLGAEVYSDEIQVGWVTTAENQAGLSVIFARS